MYSKFKASTDSKSNMDQVIKLPCNPVEKIMGKGAFSPLTTMFQYPSLSCLLKLGIVWLRVNSADKEHV